MTAPVQTATRTLSPAELAAYLALVQAQAAVRRQLTQSTVNSVLATLQAFNGWWETDQITRMVAQILRVVQPAQLQAARVTDAYLARTIGLIRNRAVRPVGAVDVTALRRKLPPNVLQDLATGRRTPTVIEIGDTVDGPNDGISDPIESLLRDNEKPEHINHADAYGRLADTYRWQIISQDATPQQALMKVLARAEMVARTDINLATRAQAQQTMRKLGVTYYRRVLHPELSDTGLSCGLCIVAADRVYTVEKLLDIHDNCNCETMPIEGGKDPGINLNRADLDSLYAAAGSTSGRELKRVRVAVTEHGELGPILIRSGTKVRDAADFARTQVPDRSIRARAQLNSMLESLTRLEARAAAGEDVTKPLRYHQDTIAALRRELGE